MTFRKITLLASTALVFMLVIPFSLKGAVFGHPVFSFVRYLLALTIAIPTAIYAVKKYRKTAVRFYIFPCFVIALGFWMTSMIAMQKLPDLGIPDNRAFATKYEKELYDNGVVTRGGYSQFTRNYYNDEERIFFNEKFSQRADTARFWN